MPVDAREGGRRGGRERGVSYEGNGSKPPRQEGDKDLYG